MIFYAFCNFLFFFPHFLRRPHRESHRHHQHFIAASKQASSIKWENIQWGKYREGKSKSLNEIIKHFYPLGSSSALFVLFYIMAPQSKRGVVEGKWQFFNLLCSTLMMRFVFRNHFYFLCCHKSFKINFSNKISSQVNSSLLVIIIQIIARNFQPHFTLFAQWRIH